MGNASARAGRISFPGGRCPAPGKLRREKSLPCLASGPPLRNAPCSISSSSFSHYISRTSHSHNLPQIRPASACMSEAPALSLLRGPAFRPRLCLGHHKSSPCGHFPAPELRGSLQAARSRDLASGGPCFRNGHVGGRSQRFLRVLRSCEQQRVRPVTPLFPCPPAPGRSRRAPGCVLYRSEKQRRLREPAGTLNYCPAGEGTVFMGK